MEYTKKDGTKVIVEGDMAKYGDGPMKKNKIGVNFVNGFIYSRMLSSFGGSFLDETISIESGLADFVDAKIGNIRDAYELLKSKLNGTDDSNIYELSSIVLETVDEYFGGISNVESRMDYYYEAGYEENKDNKISNLKGTGAAMCVERAALSQNLLKSLGINSYFKTSAIVRNGNQEVHSYNLIEFEDKNYIFDTSIPNLINGRVNPLIAEIDKETFDLLSNPISDIGRSTTVSHYNPYRDIDVTITYDSGRKDHIEVEALGSTEKHL